MNSVDVPKLDIDQQLYTNGRPHPNGVLERRIVANLITHVLAAGFKLHSVNDGDTITAVDTMKEAMELIFNLDEASLRFSTVERKSKTQRAMDSDKWHGVLLVLGNGIDVVSDWNYTNGDPDGFNKCMDAFDAEQYA